MVKEAEPSEYDKLDSLVREAASRHGLSLDVQGWTRRTYDVLSEDRRAARSELLARVESFATTNGEIRVFDDRALPFARDLGAAFEKAFGLAEAVIVRKTV